MCVIPPLTLLSPPSYVLPDDSKASRQKTRVVKRSLNPLFNHTMVYDGFQAKDLAEACAEFTLWHREAFSKHQLGGIRLSLGTGELGKGGGSKPQEPQGAPTACKGLVATCKGLVAPCKGLVAPCKVTPVVSPQGAATGCRWAGWTRRRRSGECGDACSGSRGSGWKRCCLCGPTSSPGHSPHGPLHRAPCASRTVGPGVGDKATP